MLKIPEVENEQAQENINSILKEVCHYVFDATCMSIDLKEGLESRSREEMLYKMADYQIKPEDSDGFIVCHLFPVWFPHQDMIRTLIGLYSLLMSDHTYVPPLIMEYVLEKLINIAIETAADMNGIDEIIDTEQIIELAATFDEEKYGKYDRLLGAAVDCTIFGRKFPENMREKLLKEIIDEEKALEDEEVSIREICIHARREILIWEIPCKEWFEYLFWDSDYALLDTYGVEYLRESEINERLGIMSTDANTERLFVPDDWVTSHAFRMGM